MCDAARMESEGDRILQWLLGLSVVVFITATFIGGSLATGVVWVFGMWLVVIFGGMALDAVWPKRHPKP